MPSTKNKATKRALKMDHDMVDDYLYIIFDKSEVVITANSPAAYYHYHSPL